MKHLPKNRQTTRNTLRDAFQAQLSKYYNQCGTERQYTEAQRVNAIVGAYNDYNVELSSDIHETEAFRQGKHCNPKPHKVPNVKHQIDPFMPGQRYVKKPVIDLELSDFIDVKSLGD